MPVDLMAMVDGVALLRLRPGDRLAVRIPEADIEQEDIAEMRRVLKEVWPDLAVAFFTGDIELTVIRSES